jgi:hypothetical protein
MVINRTFGKFPKNSPHFRGKKMKLPRALEDLVGF